MAVTPSSFKELDSLLDQEIEQVKPTYTYAYNFETNRIMGMTDGKNSSYQAIRKILCTDRYANLIYDWRYGHELQSLIGKPKSYAKAEIERIIKEAVMQDDRVVRVRDFKIEDEGLDFVRVSVTIDTITMPFIFDLEVPW